MHVRNTVYISPGYVSIKVGRLHWYSYIDIVDTTLHGCSTNRYEIFDKWFTPRIICSSERGKRLSQKKCWILYAIRMQEDGRVSDLTTLVGTGVCILLINADSSHSCHQEWLTLCFYWIFFTCYGFGMI